MKKGLIIPELGPLVKWLADVESVLTGKSALVYRNQQTNIQYTCAVCVNGQLVGGLFEREADVCLMGVGCQDGPREPRMELWVVGRDPACNCVTGAPLRLCTVASVGTV